MRARLAQWLRRPPAAQSYYEWQRGGRPSYFVVHSFLFYMSIHSIESQYSYMFPWKICLFDGTPFASYNIHHPSEQVQLAVSPEPHSWHLSNLRRDVSRIHRLFQRLLDLRTGRFRHLGLVAVMSRVAKVVPLHPRTIEYLVRSVGVQLAGTGFAVFVGLWSVRVHRGDREVIALLVTAVRHWSDLDKCVKRDLRGLATSNVVTHLDVRKLLLRQ